MKCFYSSNFYLFHNQQHLHPFCTGMNTCYSVIFEIVENFSCKFTITFGVNNVPALFMFELME